MSFIKLTDLDLAGKRVLIRADLNVPVKDGKVTSDARITASMPTIEHCVNAGARVMVMSHRGRPGRGRVDEENSMEPIADEMPRKLGKPVRLIKDYLESRRRSPKAKWCCWKTCVSTRAKRKTTKSWPRNTPRCVICS